MSGPMRVEVRYFAAAAAAAGADVVWLEISETASVADVELIIGRDNPDLARILPRCSYLRDAVAVRDRGAALGRCAQLDVLPPFAGG